MIFNIFLIYKGYNIPCNYKKYWSNYDIKDSKQGSQPKHTQSGLSSRQIMGYHPSFLASTSQIRGTILREMHGNEVKACELSCLDALQEASHDCRGENVISF